MERVDAVENQSRTGETLKKDETSIDCIYIAACGHDARLTRICVASIRYFYPEIPIRLLAGDILQNGLAEELHRYWRVELVDLPKGDYGSGFVKLEPLFGPLGERFLMLDPDTVLAGPVLDLWKDCRAPFLVDDEKQSDVDTKRLYYDWEKVRSIDSVAQPPRFVFNSGQWFGTAGVLRRENFAPWVNWTMPRRLRHPEYFMPGDQGILNYVLNRKAAVEGMEIERRQIMRWPGNAMTDLNVRSVSNGTAAPLVIHWAGMKKTLIRGMVGADLLLFFERFYYGRMPSRNTRRVLAIAYHVWLQWFNAVRSRVRLRRRKWFG
jgi:hypothetical protein